MTDPARAAELASLLADARSEARRAALLASAEVVREWERAHPLGIEDVLSFVEELRALFGDPPVSTAPWRGRDFRI